MQKTVETLCADLACAKELEETANERRIAIERELLELVGCPAEGSKTVDVQGWKLRIEQKISRKIDPKKWATVADQIPEQLRPIKIVEEYKVENKGVAWLRDNEPGYYKVLCQAMEEKPMKPRLVVEEVQA